MDCKHENAVYNLEFNRFSDEMGIPRLFTCDLTVFCRHCGAQFSFKDPKISYDNLTLSATIEPDDGMEEKISDALDLKDLFLNGNPEEKTD